MKNEIISLGSDAGEILLDGLLKEGLFKDIPICGTIISIASLSKNISDMLLLKKIESFVQALDLKTEVEIEAFKQKYLNEKDRVNIGSKIIFLLNNYDTDLKAWWLGKLFKQYVDKEIIKYDFYRCSAILSQAYSPDIRFIKQLKINEIITTYNDRIESYILDHLYSIGVLSNQGSDGGDSAGNNSGTRYALNKFGIILQKIID